jgi:uncharacterized protein YciI
MEYFVIYFTQGEEWIKGKPIGEQGLQQHLEYWLKYGEEGKVLAGGPFMDSSGGIMVLEVKDVEEAKNLVSKDPAVTDKKLKPEIHQWRPVINNF